jgi:hypothetical protein
MATTANPRQRKARSKTAEPPVTAVAFPSLAEGHLDIPTLEHWLWDAACAIRGAADAPKLEGTYR